MSGSNRRVCMCEFDEHICCNEEDELCGSENVPNEVRDWLNVTFTRSLSNVSSTRNETLKFKNIAHAIRAGIMVDKIYKAKSTLTLYVPPSIVQILKTINDWDFDVFSLNENSDKHAMKYVGFELLQRYDLLSKYKIANPTLESFLLKLEKGYSKYKNPYHNLVHGADVAQGVHVILVLSKLVNWLSDIQIFATLTSALIHDYEHTGTTNNFHIVTGSELAMMYNDKSILENHHLSAAFRIMKEEDSNILSNLSREEYKEFRTLVVDMVLATDMSFHFQQIKTLKGLLEKPESIDKAKALSMILHSADIGHPAKEWNLHYKWSNQVVAEFFNQGDREKALELPVSPLCDRNTVSVAESQVGFIDFIVTPCFNCMSEMLEAIVFHLLKEQQEAIEAGEPKKDKSTSTDSLHSSSEPLFDFPKPWVEIIASNKQKWKDIAAKDAEERKKKEEATVK